MEKWQRTQRRLRMKIATTKNRRPKPESNGSETHPILYYHFVECGFWMHLWVLCLFSVVRISNVSRQKQHRVARHCEWLRCGHVYVCVCLCVYATEIETDVDGEMEFPHSYFMCDRKTSSFVRSSAMGMYVRVRIH